MNCVPRCHCLGKAVLCKDLNHHLPLFQFINFTFIHISSSHILFRKAFGINFKVNILLLVKAGITALSNPLDVWQLRNLMLLNLSHNKISYLTQHSLKQPMTSLKVLVLSNNHVKDISHSALANFENLSVLDISANNLSVLEASFLSNLLNLKGIFVQNNFLNRIHRTFFAVGNLQFLVSDKYQVCCLAQSQNELICISKEKQYFPCRRFQHTVNLLKVLIWPFSVFLMFFNAISTVLNFLAFYGKQHRKQEMESKNVFHFLSYTCGMSNTFVGLYCVSVAENTWRLRDFISLEPVKSERIFCSFLTGIGLWALLSAHLHVLLFSFVRFVAIKYPFSRFATLKSQKNAVFLLYFVSFCLALAALSPRLYLKTEPCSLLGPSSGTSLENFSTASFAAFLLISRAILVITYTKLLSTTGSSSKIIQSFSMSHTRNCKLSRNLKMCIFLTCAANIASWLPCAIFLISTLISRNYPKILLDVTETLILPLFSFLNPFVTNFQALKRVCFSVGGKKDKNLQI